MIRNLLSFCKLPATLLCLSLVGCASAPIQRDKVQRAKVASRPAGVSPTSGIDRVATNANHALPRTTPVAPIADTNGAEPGVSTVSYTCQSCPEPNQNRCSSGACSSGACPPSQMGYLPVPGPMNTFGVDPQEFICDGGDHPPEARVMRDDSINGLQGEDTIVHYTTEAGDIEIHASNRVCLYSPRFKSVRKITGAVAGEHAIGLRLVDLPVGAGNLEINEGGAVLEEAVELAHADVARSIDAMRERNRGVPVENVLQPEQAIDVLAILAGLSFDQISMLTDDQKALLEEHALAAVAWTLDESVEVAIEDLKAPTLTRDQSVEGFTVYDFPDAGRLKICKLADRQHARPGEIVNFAISVENVGDSAVDRVVLTDNLTTRLEYIDESQTCTAGAVFEAKANQGQSLQLIWNMTDSLKVGESFTIRFRCKVR